MVTDSWKRGCRCHVMPSLAGAMSLNQIDKARYVFESPVSGRFVSQRSTYYNNQRNGHYVQPSIYSETQKFLIKELFSPTTK